MKKKKSGTSKAEQLRAIREKNAASTEKSAKTPKGKKPKAAKPAKAPKQSKAKKSTALVLLVDPKITQRLNADAIENESRLAELIPQHMARGVEIYNVMQDHQERELWKYGKTPYKSWTAFVEHYAELASISKRTLQAVISSNKALPGVSAEVKKKIGPRKLKKVVAAVVKHRKKTGNPAAEAPAEIIDAAVRQPEAEFDRTLESAGLAPESEAAQAPAEVARQMFDRNSIEDTAEGFSVDRTDEPVVDVARKGNKTMEDAVLAARELYAVEDNPLVFICDRFLKEQYDGPHEHLHDTTNAAAYDELFGKPKNGKKGKRK